MPRLFTGLKIPADIGFALSMKRGGLQGARWIDPDNYHVTLRFIGDIDNGTANDVADGLDRLAMSASFDLTITGLGIFGGEKPRALYGAIEPNVAPTRLQAAQERIIQSVGIEPEGRKFVPHITLARLRGTHPADVAQFIAYSGRFAPLQFTVENFVLLSSRDSVGGGPYVVEETYPLAVFAQ